MIAFLLTLSRMLKAFFMAWKDKEFQVLFVLTALTLTIGTTFYSTIEGMRVIDALYFSVVTLTTVGYGDFSPQTDFGKIFTIFYIFIGIGLIAGFIRKIALTIAASNIVSSERKNKKNHDNSGNQKIM
ncbi:potassium channel family protein [Rummeliibacillus pycnus]|uniref:potassium channel family protein n=1 Tax=Rummeliibacillus pycnus TaxID=101070 RepID=UPI0037C6DB9A